MANAANHHADVCKVVDELGGHHDQLMDLHKLSRDQLPTHVIQSDVVMVRTRFVPTSLALQISDRPEVDRRAQADRLVASRFLGKPHSGCEL